MSAQPWRFRCPEGHANIRLYVSSYRCGTCGRAYDGDPVDLAPTEASP